MSSRRITAFVESLRRNRRPKPFTPEADDVEVDIDPVADRLVVTSAGHDRPSFEKQG